MPELVTETVEVDHNAPSPWTTRKIFSVLSAPRFGPTDCFHSIATCLIQFGIPFNKVGGANWGQCLERAIEDAIEKGAEWVLTWDYDTIITPEKFGRMLWLFENSPQFDAMAPIEIRRESSEILSAWGADTTQEDIQKYLAADVVESNTAHFGCTLIRADILRKMPKPWFHHKPAPDGSWNDGRMDDDIGFWHKLKDSGGRLGIAMQVCIGHCQLMATWMMKDLRIVHQHMNDYHANGPPAGVQGEASNG